MTILIPGSTKTEDTFKTQCLFCECVFSFHRDEVKWKKHKNRLPIKARIPCPHCGKIAFQDEYALRYCRQILRLQ